MKFPHSFSWIFQSVNCHLYNSCLLIYTFEFCDSDLGQRLWLFAFLKYLFIYLTALGISCDTRGLFSCSEKQRHYFANKGPSSQGYGFSSGQVWMWELGYKESWAPRNWCFWTVVLEKTLESPLDCKEIQPVHPKGDQSWVFIGGLDAEAETPILCHQLTHWKRPWCRERLRAGGEGDNRGWGGWMASSTQWTWVWVDSGS